MKPTTLVVGAGISGLLFARQLQAAGQPVTVLEKSRGLGGRMATKRVGPAMFDHGAQFFTTRTPEFADLVAEWVKAGLVREWASGAHPRYFCPGGMTSLPKYLAEGLDVRREHQVTAMRPEGGHWVVDVVDLPCLTANRLVLTAPVGQSLALLKAGKVNLPADVFTALAPLTYHPCLVILVVLDEVSALPVEGLAPVGGSIRWLADNTKKGISPGVAAAVTIQANPAFAAAHYEKSEAEIAALLLPEAQAWLRGRVVSTTLHRWRYSEPKATHPEPCIWRPELALGLVGDAFGGPKVEGAALSGLSLARRL
jgi:predicted NAD/FAD-dependent oxidoreductase